MHQPTRRCWIGALVFVALVSSFLGGIPSLAHAATREEKLAYYGADLTKMTLATGVNFQQPGMVDPTGPWPQRTNNYCFVAVVQALTNYADLMTEIPIRYPSRNDQGPASGNPADEQSGQILYDMDHRMIPPGGPLQIQGSGANRRPYTLANTAYDFGGDPRSQAFGTNFEAPWQVRYHEHIYHTGPEAATLGMAKALALYSEPVIAFVNHAEHSVIVAGVWADGNPLTDPDAQIRSLAIYNPWNIKWGAYLSTSNYVVVSYDDWINATNLPSSSGGIKTWLNQPYLSNGKLDPDPSIGIYQAGPGTRNPNAHHWIGNYVMIQPDSHPVSANFSFDENDRLMVQP